MVPVDFDWQKLNAITDKDLFALYSQLPEEARFLAIFDCCFSGGLIKGPRGPVRNLPVPDEIRHAVQACADEIVFSADDLTPYVRDAAVLADLRKTKP